MNPQFPRNPFPDPLKHQNAVETKAQQPMGYWEAQRTPGAYEPLPIPDWLGIACLILCVLGIAWRRKEMRTKREARGGRALNGDPLDDELFRWTRKDIFSVRSLLASIAGFGATGSGKSSGPAKWLGEAIVRHPRSSMLILAAKPEDAGEWRRYFANADRQHDLVVFEPGGQWQFNLLDFIVKSGGSYRDVAKCLVAIGETLQPVHARGGEDNKFFAPFEERVMHDAAVMVHLGTGGITIPDLQRFLLGVANTVPEMALETWKAGYHNQVLRAATAAAKTAEQAAYYEVAKDTFIRELPALADKTRSSGMAGIINKFHYMNTGIARDLLTHGTNVSPLDALKRGKSILVNTAPSEHGGNGSVVNAALKWAMQWAVLRRHAEPKDFFNVIFADEAPQFVNAADSDYLAQCRSHLGCMIYFAQSRHSYYAALGGGAGRHKADALLANFNLKIFNALGDAETAEWSSDLVGREIKTLFGGSVAPQEGGLWEEAFGKQRLTSNFSTHFERIVEPNQLMHGLRTGGAANRYVVDSMLVKTGEPFSNGRNWMQVSFSQR